MKAIAISTEGGITELVDVGLETLQTAVGGYIEAVTLSHRATLWLNEEGKLKKLPHNPYAQQLWDNVYGAKTDYIVGDVVVTGGTDDEGETISLTDAQVNEIVELVEKVNSWVSPRAAVFSATER
jgi:hypothetical protein